MTEASPTQELGLLVSLVGALMTAVVLMLLVGALVLAAYGLAKGIVATWPLPVILALTTLGVWVGMLVNFYVGIVLGLFTIVGASMYIRVRNSRPARVHYINKFGHVTCGNGDVGTRDVERVTCGTCATQFRTSGV